MSACQPSAGFQRRPFKSEVAGEHSPVYPARGEWTYDRPDEDRAGWADWRRLPHPACNALSETSLHFDGRLYDLRECARYGPTAGMQENRENHCNHSEMTKPERLCSYSPRRRRSSSSSSATRDSAVPARASAAIRPARSSS